MKRIFGLLVLIGILLCLTEKALWRESMPVGNYDEARNSYQLFLSGKKYGSDSQFILKILSGRDTEYSIVDMNGDAIPELAVKSCVLQYYTADDYKMWGTISLCAIFTFEDGAVKLWYAGDQYNDFEILDNRALLYVKEEAPNSYQYDYIDLDHNGELKYSLSLYKERRINSEQNDGWFFSIHENGGQDINGYRIVEQEEWDEKVEELLELRTDQITWEKVVRQGD